MRFARVHAVKVNVESCSWARTVRPQPGVRSKPAAKKRAIKFKELKIQSWGRGFQPQFTSKQ